MAERTISSASKYAIEFAGEAPGKRETGDSNRERVISDGGRSRMLGAK
jgi:hypothetical protein